MNKDNSKKGYKTYTPKTTKKKKPKKKSTKKKR